MAGQCPAHRRQQGLAGDGSLKSNPRFLRQEKRFRLCDARIAPGCGLSRFTGSAMISSIGAVRWRGQDDVFAPFSSAADKIGQQIL
jgi:hypothetical protein